MRHYRQIKEALEDKRVQSYVVEKKALLKSVQSHVVEKRALLQLLSAAVLVLMKSNFFFNIQKCMG